MISIFSVLLFITVVITATEARAKRKWSFLFWLFVTFVLIIAELVFIWIKIGE